MKKPIVYIAIAGIIMALVASFFLKNNKSVVGDCSKFSNKDGYTGCMSLTKGKDKKCKFKVDNKINQATQQMEFEYLCLEK